MCLNHCYKYINTNGVEIYLLSLSDSIGLIDTSIIPKSQLIEINQYHNQQDRDKRLLARSFLYSYLKEHDGIDKFDLAFNNYNKPYLKHYPKLHFNFSYSNDAVLVGVSKTHVFGLDVEYIDLKLPVNNIFSTIFSKEEKKYFHHLQSITEKQFFFYRIFTLKESLIKAMGMGLYFDTTSINCLSLLSGQAFIYKDDCYYSEVFDLHTHYQFALSYKSIYL